MQTETANGHLATDSSSPNLAALTATRAASVATRPRPDRPGLVEIETSDTRPVFRVKAADWKAFQHLRRQSRMCRALIAGAELQQQEFQRASSKVRVAFITLTYRPGVEWKARHVSEALKRFRHWCERRGWRLPYEWKAELQKRGAVHFHVVAWLPLALSVQGYKLDAIGWWPHGMTNFVWARNPVGYVAKYVSKAEAQKLPKGIRMHGRGGMLPETRRAIRYTLLPRYVREQFSAAADVVRARGGGWVDRLTGEWVPACQLVIA